jgi:hypothetical protein
MSASDPAVDEPNDRIAEIGELLAGGLMRLQNRKSSPIRGESRESSVHFTPNQSGHANSISLEIGA